MKEKPKNYQSDPFLEWLDTAFHHAVENEQPLFVNEEQLHQIMCTDQFVPHADWDAPSVVGLYCGVPVVRTDS